MPIILTPGPPSSNSTQNNITHTAQDVITAASQDLRKQLGSSGSDATILLDYCSRISLQMLRSSRWKFLESDPIRFITALGVTDYWIGLAGSQGQGQLDTGLNLSDVQHLIDSSFVDRSNNTQIYRTYFQPPNLTGFEYPDGQSRPLRPTNFFHRTFSNVIQLFPAPDNQNTYQPVPESPVVVSTTSGGSLSARTYTIRYSIVDSAGLESSASGNAAKIFIPAGKLLTVQSPSALFTGSAETVSYNQYKVYAASSGSIETVQNAGAAINLGSNFTEPTSGLTSNGASYPTVNNLTPILGYVMEFKYYKKRLSLTNVSQSLQIPDDYFDTIVAGVNMYGFQFLEASSEVKMWGEIYQQGLREMVRDREQFAEGKFMMPDVSTQNFPSSLIPGFISGN